MLIVDLTYIKPLSEVEKHVDAHREYLQEFYDKNMLIVSGPKQPKTGGVIVANLSEEVMRGIIENDPFFKENIAEFRVISFDPVKRSESFAALISPN